MWPQVLIFLWQKLLLIFCLSSEAHISRLLRRVYVCTYIIQVKLLLFAVIGPLILLVVYSSILFNRR